MILSEGVRQKPDGDGNEYINFKIPRGNSITKRLPKVVVTVLKK